MTKAMKTIRFLAMFAVACLTILGGPVMIIDVESAEAASAQKENAYRMLEKFYRSRM